MNAPGAFPATHIDETVFELLDPIHELDCECRRTLLNKAKCLRLAGGERVCAKDFPWSLLYLLQGSVSRERPGLEPELIREGHDSTTLPLFSGDSPRQTSVVAQDDSEFILLDQQLFESLAEQCRGQGQEVAFLDMNPVESSLFQELTEQFFHGRLEIPRLPAVAERVLQLASDPDIPAHRLNELVALDPALATRIITTARAYGKPAGITAAVDLLGPTRVIDICLSMALEGICTPRSPLIHDRLLEAYRHSVHVAAYSFVLAERLDDMDPDRALLFGLLHDVGKFAVLRAAENHLERLGGETELDAVVWKLHGVVGGLVLENWGFGREFVEVAEESDDWRRNSGLRPDYTDVVLVAQLHSFIGTERMKGLPRFSSLPAFRKVAGRQPGPGFSLWLLQKTNKRIVEIEHMLCPGEKQAGRPNRQQPP